jgi:hypothetical protein
LDELLDLELDDLLELELDELLELEFDELLELEFEELLELEFEELLELEFDELLPANRSSCSAGALSIPSRSDGASWARRMLFIPPVSTTSCVPLACAVPAAPVRAAMAIASAVPVLKLCFIALLLQSSSLVCDINLSREMRTWGRTFNMGE